MGRTVTGARCRSCGAHVIWATTATGKAMPVDAEAVDAPDAGNIFLTFLGGQLAAQVVEPAPGLRKSHFATCPNANTHRRRP